MLLALAMAVSLGGAYAQPEFGTGTNEEEGPEWQALQSFSTVIIPQPRSVMVGGKLYVLSGHNTSMYDPATNSWQYNLAPVPTARDNVAFAAVEGKIYAIGGYSLGSNRVAMNLCEMYDPATDTWTEKAPMRVASSGPGVCVLDGLIYAMDLNATQYYNPATDTWTRRATATPAFSLGSFPSLAPVDGKIYCFGGNQRAYHVYDPQADSWARVANMPTPRYSLSAVPYEGKVYCMGGMMSDRVTATNMVEIYDPETDTWSTGPSMLSSRSSFEAFSNGSVIYAVGGMVTPSWRYGAEKFGLPSQASVPAWRNY